MAKRRRGDNAAKKAEQDAGIYERGTEKFFGRPIRPEIVGNYRQGMEGHYRRLWGK